MKESIREQIKAMRGPTPRQLMDAMVANGHNPMDVQTHLEEMLERGDVRIGGTRLYPC